METVLEALPLSSMTGVVEFEAVEFAVGNGFWKFGSLIVDDEDVTDLGVLAEADWLRRAASWDLVRQTGLVSEVLSVTQSWSVVTLPKMPVLAVKVSAARCTKCVTPSTMVAPRSLKAFTSAARMGRSCRER